MGILYRTEGANTETPKGPALRGFFFSLSYVEKESVRFPLIPAFWGWYSSPDRDVSPCPAPSATLKEKGLGCRILFLKLPASHLFLKTGKAGGTGFRGSPAPQTLPFGKALQTLSVSSTGNGGTVIVCAASRQFIPRISQKFFANSRLCACKKTADVI